MKECLKIVDFTDNFLKLPEDGKKLKVENMLLMIYVEKTPYFEVVPPCHTMLTNTHIDILL